LVIPDDESLVVNTLTLGQKIRARSIERDEIAGEMSNEPVARSVVIHPVSCNVSLEVV
jgi:hypothetical protein